MKTNIITMLAMLTASAAIAQDTAQPSPANPPTLPFVIKAGTDAPAAVPAAPAASAPAVAAPAPAAAGSAPAPAAAAPAAAVQAPLANDTAPVPKNEIRMNFQGTSLTDVLNYLSSAAGFVIVQQTPVSGTVNIISKQPVTADEAVTLLDQVLAQKGYTVIRNGRILNIVPRAGAQTNPDMEVDIGADYKIIPKVAEMATQIIPVKHVDATKLIDNLRPLLAADASMTVNEGSNAILLTDTKANIHRVVEIVQALDTSVSSLSTIKVYPLRYADAKDFANVLTQLFSPDDSASRNGGQGGAAAFFAARFGGGGRGGGGGGGGGGDDTGAAGESEARKAASRVVAVADEQSNSVVVSAPDEYIPTIDEIVTRLDTSTTDVTQTRIFQLEHADSGEVSIILNSLYGDATTLTSTSNNRNGQGQNGRGGGGGGNRGGGGQPASSATQPSSRELQQARMVAVPDPRTNSILVNCSPDTMLEVATTIGRLDSSDAKRQKVYVVNLQHADPETVAPILRTLFHDTVSTSGTNNVLANRITTGVSSDVSSTMTSGGSSGGGTGGGR